MCPGLRLFSDASCDVADPFLRRAFVLAENGRGTTSPNPLVGCVLVRDGIVVGEGWHQRAGGPHAEVAALADAGERGRGATAYVTLEPCDHTGRTGPCTLALREAGVASVVIGMRDPNPGVSGCGADTLRRAGITVVFAEDPRPFEQQNEGWLKYVRTGRPWVCVKVALTLDGRPALAPATRSAITGAGGAEVTRRLRAASDAVLVGAVTAEVDDPALTVRDTDGTLAPRQPVRVVLGRSKAPSASLRLFATAGGLRPAVLLLPSDADAPPGVTVVRYPEDDGITAALRALSAECGVVSVLVEPGPRLFQALWDGGAIDGLVVVTAGGIAGGAAPPLHAGGPAAMDTSRLVPRMTPLEAGVIEHDAVTVWRPLGSAENDTERE